MHNNAYRTPEGDGRPEPVPGGQASAQQCLYFHRDYLDAVRTGRKTTTVRFRDPVTVGPVDMVFELDEDLVLPGTVTRLATKTVGELSEEDAVADGFADLPELLGRLRYHYPHIAPEDEITVVHFRTVESDR
ncbi:ASCH domain-containing protein [Streptomyces sp. NPDC053429]|uniref:ASCH domain-containing protein n=1 Tax=Streptomyces sp. NPDC053429 TaxID=3365702 RepID=UPI0037D34AE7